LTRPSKALSSLDEYAINPNVAKVEDAAPATGEIRGVKGELEFTLGDFQK
jgi:hypothetical protein